MRMVQAMKDFKPRLIMTACAVIFLFVFIGLSPHAYFRWVFTGGVASIASFALWEYFQIAKMKGIIPQTKVGIIGAICYTYALYCGIEYHQFFLPLFALMILLPLLFILHLNETEKALTSIAVTYFGFIYIVVSFSGIIAIIYYFPEVKGTDGRLWLIYLLAVTKMADIGGLLIGRFLGKKLLLPKVSPNKTVAGAFGGIIFSTVTSLLFTWALELTWIQAILLGICLGVFSEIGDLAESLLKRDGKIKDSNPYFPGLGGTLDTIDSLLFTTPIVCFFLQVVR